MCRDENNINHDCNCGCQKIAKGWFPLNSTVQVNRDRSITIQAPSGWEYIGVTERERCPEVLKISSGVTSVSCTCNTSGDCLPFTGSGPQGNTSGCAGNCSNCTMKQSARLNDRVYDFVRGGFIDFSDSVRFVEHNSSLPSVFEEMFELPEVIKSLETFFERVCGGLPAPAVRVGDNFVSAPTGYAMAPISILGRVAMVAVPVISLPPTLQLSIGGAGVSKASCSCTSGTCKIKTRSLLGVGSLAYCEGDCSGTCTLSTGKIIGGGVETIAYTAVSYQF